MFERLIQRAFWTRIPWLAMVLVVGSVAIMTHMSVDGVMLAVVLDVGAAVLSGFTDWKKLYSDGATKALFKHVLNDFSVNMLLVPAVFIADLYDFSPMGMWLMIGSEVPWFVLYGAYITPRYEARNPHQEEKGLHPDMTDIG